MKQLLKAASGITLAAMLAACGSSGGGSSSDQAQEPAENNGTQGEAAYEELTITLSHNQPVSSPEHIGAESFKEHIETETDGAITVDIYPALQLGGLREQVEATQIGEIDITLQPSAVVSPFVDDIKVVDLPYLWPADAKAMYEVLDGEAGQELLGTLEQGGFKGLGFWPGGYKLFTTGEKEIRQPSDFEGITMRTMESPLLIEQYKGWGGNAIPVPYAELYNSLQQGVVDGQENPLQTIFLNNYHEVQSNIIESYHGTMTYVFMANQMWYDGLSEDAQNVITEAEAAGKEAAREALTETEDEYRQQIKDAGVNYYELTAEEIEAFRKASQPMHKELYSTPEQQERLEKLYEAIEAATAE
ncbi:TRAP transporter substrate-binding protein [Bacillaceae bacterium SIJ1]|uniref:TRAP transporter substrate-binding protein n=1 Tax=Litoribacterium kuwaitense TaxID=1398745 RepID=UPI0013EA2CAA|nr:TRAP transporter substrate-binding protein [Litoribacterium kuwaitense]NGP44858.1 TRAP transporter substrate-binding protein [Litoribacterium kuwaitense]